MHDQLLEHQQELGPGELLGHAAAIGIDVGLFADTLRHHAGAARIAKDVDGADLSGVTGTPTFFVNGRRHYGSFDVDALAAVVQTARARALVARQP
jgi:protein-disulfide isomerase